MTAPDKFDPLSTPPMKPPAGMGRDAAGSYEAMRRAACQARKLAQQTGTDLTVVRVHPPKTGAS